MIHVVSPKKIPILRMKQILTKPHPLFLPILSALLREVYKSLKNRLTSPPMILEITPAATVPDSQGIENWKVPSLSII